MKRSCGCPYVHTNTESKDSKNAAVPKRPSNRLVRRPSITVRAPLGQIQNIVQNVPVEKAKSDTVEQGTQVSPIAVENNAENAVKNAKSVKTAKNSRADTPACWISPPKETLTRRPSLYETRTIETADETPRTNLPSINSSESSNSQAAPARHSFPREKTAFLMQNEAKKDSKNAFVGDAFVNDYVEDIIGYLSKCEFKYTLKRNFLKAAKIQKEDRNYLINWLYTIMLEKKLTLNKSIYFMVIRLFDFVLASGEIPRNKLQLVLIVICHILLKTHETPEYCVPISYLLKLAGNRYKREELIEYERKIFNMINFDVNINEPETFYIHCLKLVNIPLDHAIGRCGCYILEMFTFSDRFSTFSSKELACAAIYLSLDVFGYKSHYKMLENTVLNIAIDEIEDIVTNFKIHLHKITDEYNKVNGEIVFKKYTSTQFKKISLNLMERLKK